MRKKIQKKQALRAGRRRLLPTVLWASLLVFGALTASLLFLALSTTDKPAIQALYAGYAPVILDPAHRNVLAGLMLFGTFGSPIFAIALAWETLSKKGKVCLLLLLVLIVGIAGVWTAISGVIHGVIEVPSRWTNRVVFLRQDPSEFWFCVMIHLGVGVFLVHLVVGLYRKLGLGSKAASPISVSKP